MSVPFRWFSARRKLKGQAWPCTHWRGFLVGSLGIVAVSFAVFDYPVGKMAKELNPAVLDYGSFVTDFGNSGWILFTSFVAFVVGIAAAGGASEKTRRLRARGVFMAQAAAFLFISVASSGLAVNLIKKTIGRARPSMLYENYGPFSFQPLEFSAKFASFPSGHSTTTAVFFTAAAFFFPKHRVLFFSIAVCIAISRAIVGAHYPSDVAAGLAFGAWCAYFVAILFSRYRMVFRIDESGWPVPRNSMAALKLDFLHRSARKRGRPQSELDLSPQKGH